MAEIDNKNNSYDWAKELPCAVTVCDTEGTIIYMNDKSIEVNVKDGSGSIVGKNLKDCHSEKSWKMIQHLIATEGTNTYTIYKEAQKVKKLIYQTSWFKDGKIGGLVELSIELPENMPHFIRK